MMNMGIQQKLIFVAILVVACARIPWDRNDLIGGLQAPPGQETCGHIRGYSGPRLVVVGDLHGDYEALADTLTAAGVIADRSCDAWVGGDATLVQMGDVVDRGPDGKRCNECLRFLQGAAAPFGGSVVRLVGNHELMWAQNVFRYAHDSETAESRVARGASLSLQLE